MILLNNIIKRSGSGWNVVWVIVIMHRHVLISLAKCPTLLVLLCRLMSVMGGLGVWCGVCLGSSSVCVVLYV